MRVSWSPVALILAVMVPLGGCERDAGGGKDPVADASPAVVDGAADSPADVFVMPYAPPQGALAELCAIVPFDFGAGQLPMPACPPTPPGPPAPCQPGTICQYVQAYSQQVDQLIAYCGPASTYVWRSSTCHPSCPPPDPSIAVLVEGTACGEREAHECPAATPGMTRYDRLSAAVAAVADSCGLPSHGSGVTVTVWFEGDCARQLAVRYHQSIEAVRDCLARKLGSVRFSCVEGFPCAGVSRQLD